MPSNARREKMTKKKKLPQKHATDLIFLYMKPVGIVAAVRLHDSLRD
jgi:hypothetical protein